MDTDGGRRVFNRLCPSSSSDNGSSRNYNTHSNNNTNYGKQQKVCFHWRQGKCTRYPCSFLHSELPTAAGNGKRPAEESHRGGGGGLRRSGNYHFNSNNSSTWGRSQSLSQSRPHVGGSSSGTAVKKIEKLCSHWVLGTCKFGETCKYLHKWSTGDCVSLLTQLEGHQKVFSEPFYSVGLDCGGLVSLLLESNYRMDRGSCACYKVSGLRETILSTDKTANLNERYTLGQQLGWGQFGVIRECVDKSNGEVLACKSIAKDRLVTQEDIRSIKLEIEIMTELSGHPNVVDLKAVYEEENHVHLVMELCAGGELFHELEKQGRFSESDARVVFRQLMRVVMYCHDKGVVHRDLKPENILLATKSSSSPIKLADFGLATYISHGQSLHGTVGSPFYIAPEVLSRGYDRAADIWSAGVILYILLSGIPPFWGKTKSQIFDAVRAADLRFPSNSWDLVSDSAKDLIEGMLCKDTSRRLTAQQVLDHSWVTDIPPLFTDLREQGYEPNFDKDHLSSNLVDRSQDISFGMGSSIISEAQSPSFTCMASFSSLVGPTYAMPSSEAIGFSFHCGGDSFGAPAPVIALPSFAFLSAAKQENDGDSLELLVDSTRVDLIAIATDTDPKAAEVKDGGFGGVWTFGIHSRRNHTIGVSEFDHLRLVVTDSIIRWASCTCLPTAASLRSSLVC